MKVLNKRTSSAAEQAGSVYVGRPSKWGNPFSIGRDGDRAEVISKFRSYMFNRLAQEPEWLEPLRDKNLTCWCSPLACHAEVIIAEIEADDLPF